MALLSDAGLAALYLRRLGFSETEAQEHANQRPLSGDKPSKALLTDLISRHVLRVPFENLEQHAVPLGDGVSRPATPVEERLQRLRNVRGMVERIASGSGGICTDLNVTFAWLLTQLGASARLAMAWVWTGEHFSKNGASHVIVIVDLPEGPVLADPGFGDPPRTTVCIAGESADVFATYEVVNNPATEGDVTEFQRVLRVRRDGNSKPRGLEAPEDAAPEETDASAWTTLYAFRHLDDLTYDAEEIQKALEVVHSPGSWFSQKRVICLGTPKGHIVLSPSRKKVVEAGKVEETPMESEEQWLQEARALLSRPMVTKIEAVAKPNRFTGHRHSFAAPSMGRTASNSEAMMSRTQSLGIVDAGSLAVGGAGSGGGLGLNAPGFNVKVKHFAGGGGAATTGKKTLTVDPEVKAAWMRVVDDADPLTWVYCDYSADGKHLVLAKSGTGGLSEFKAVLDDTTIAWGGFRCYGVDSRGNVQCRRPKFIFVQHKPEGAPAIKKAKQAAQKGEVKDNLPGAHVDVSVENVEQDLDEQVLITKLQAATGAHKPNGYQFEEGVVLEADFYGLGIGKNCKGESSTKG